MADEPESTAARTALWRALHVQLDAPPHVLEDEVGLRLVDPAPGWRDRPDMQPDVTKGFRASIVARARFVEDLLAERPDAQYVILGAGVDTYAQREPGRRRVFEIDQAGPQEWKRRRLTELGYPVPELIPVDFEIAGDWWARLLAAGFEPDRPALVVSTGVSMYLTREASLATLTQLAQGAPAATVAMTFTLPTDLIDPADRPGWEFSRRGAQASGTPFISFYSPAQLLSLGREAGFTDVRHVSGSELAERYFAGRPDGLRPSTGEDFLLAGAGQHPVHAAGGGQ